MVRPLMSVCVKGACVKGLVGVVFKNFSWVNVVNNVSMVLAVG